MAEWIKSACPETEAVEIPEGKPTALGAGDMFDPNGVVFKGNKEAHHVRYASPEQAALVAALAEVGSVDTLKFQNRLRTAVGV